MDWITENPVLFVALFAGAIALIVVITGRDLAGLKHRDGQRNRHGEDAAADDGDDSDGSDDRRQS